MWHHVTVLEPPETFIRDIQKRIVDFFWSGQHWTRAPVLYLPLQESGQSLTDRSCRVKTALYGEGLAWAGTAHILLQCLENINYDKHVFVLNLREIRKTGVLSGHLMQRLFGDVVPSILITFCSVRGLPV